MTPATAAPDITERAAQVLAAINDFEACLSGATPELLAQEKFKRLAVERSFEIICGTLSRLSSDVKVQ